MSEEKFVVVVTYGNTMPNMLFTGQGRTYEEAVKLRALAKLQGYTDARIEQEDAYLRNQLKHWEERAAGREVGYAAKEAAFWRAKIVQREKTATRRRGKARKAKPHCEVG